MLPACQVQKASRTVFEMPQLNYRQTVSVDRFTLEKINIARSRNHDYK